MPAFTCLRRAALLVIVLCAMFVLAVAHLLTMFGTLAAFREASASDLASAKAQLPRQ